MPTATLNIPIVSFIIAHSLSLTIVPCFCIIRSDSVQYSKAALTYAWSPFFVAESAEKVFVVSLFIGDKETVFK